MKKTHDVAVALVAKFYGEAIRRSYYLGSSQGGREALIVVQRFPQDYDGVFAQVPAHAYVHLSIGDPLARAKAQAGDGWIPPAKVRDRRQGSPAPVRRPRRHRRRARQQLSRLQSQIRSGGDAEPLAAVRCRRRRRHRRRLPLGRADSRGKCRARVGLRIPFPLEKGWTIVCRVANRQRVGRQLEDAADAADGRHELRRAAQLGSSATPTANLLDVDLATYAKEIQQLSATIDATDPDLSAFKRRGGKLIMKVNTTDYTVNPRWVMDYFDKIVQTMGKSVVNEFLRFYVAVGIFHNRNVGRNPVTNALVPAYVDFIAMLDDWVEHGRTPADTQVLSDMDTVPPFTVHATFPMCRYPMYPRYQGKGDPKAAGSYACTR